MHFPKFPQNRDLGGISIFPWGQRLRYAFFLHSAPPQSLCQFPLHVVRQKRRSLLVPRCAGTRILAVWGCAVPHCFHELVVGFNARFDANDLWLGNCRDNCRDFHESRGVFELGCIAQLARILPQTVLAHEVWIAVHAGVGLFAVLAPTRAGHTPAPQPIVLALQVWTAPLAV